MKLTGVCGRCSPHRNNWMPAGGYWVFHNNLHNSSHNVSLLSVSRLISVGFGVVLHALAHSL